MSHRYWPLRGLRIRTPRLELRLPDEALLDQLATVATGGVHAADRMPFLVPWTDGTPDEVGRATYQHVLGTIAGWTPEEWHLSLVVLHKGQAVGRQDVMGKEFGVRREVVTGSWLGLPHQRQGIGTEMRAAALHLAFAGLGARYAVSEAWTDNAGSLGVSRKLGYEPDGLQIQVIRGEAAPLRRLRLDRAGWEKHRSVDVTVEGLDACRVDFGV